MANYTRTIEYALASNFATLAGNTLLTFATRTLTIAETTSRSFVSVFLVLSFDPNVTAVTTSTTQPVVTLKLGAASASSVNVPIDTNNGDDYRDICDGELWLDFTAYFTANFGGSSTQTCVVTALWPAAISTKNHTAKIVITYAAATTNTTQTKTVRIPLEGARGLLATSLASGSLGSGGAEVPNLSTFLPEASVSIKEIFFDCSTTIQRPAATNPVLSVSLDAEGATSLAANNLGSMGTSGDLGRNRFIWQRLDMNTSVTHDFKCATSVAATASLFFAILTVTYTYDDSATTTVLNSLILPLVPEMISQVNTSTLGPVQLSLDFWISEPATVTYVQSAVQVVAGYLTDPVSAPLDPPQLATGTNGYVTYASPETLASFVSINAKDHITLFQRVDPAANGGQAPSSFGRGKNSLSVHFKTNGTQDTSIAIFGGWYYLNYTSAKHASGTAVHSRSVAFLLMGESAVSNSVFNLNTSVWTPSATTQTISESFWSMVGQPYGGSSGLVGIKTNATLTDQLNIGTQFNSGSDGMTGWFQHTPILIVSATLSFRDILPSVNRYIWDRGSWEPNSAARVSPFGVSRQWTIGTFSTSNYRASMMGWYTYTAISFTAAGTVAGYSGSGSGITVNIHRSDTNELVATCTTSSGGAYTATVPDNTIQLYAEALQDSQHLGRSDLFYAS